MLSSSRLYDLPASISVTGISNQQPKGLLMQRTLPNLTMDSLTSMSHSKRFNICSFHKHGLINGLSMVKELCHKCDIILLQENWIFKGISVR